MTVHWRRPGDFFRVGTWLSIGYVHNSSDYDARRYNRQITPREITESFILISTRLLLWSMLPLAIAISLDFYWIAETILKSPLAAVLAAILFLSFFVLWFALP